MGEATIGGVGIRDRLQIFARPTFDIAYSSAKRAIGFCQTSS
jgi:hypothetical protein